MMGGTCRDDGDCANGVCCDTPGTNTKTCRDQCGGNNNGIPMMCQTDGDCTNQVCCDVEGAGQTGKVCLDQCPQCFHNADCGAGSICCANLQDIMNPQLACETGDTCSGSLPFPMEMYGGLCEQDSECTNGRTCQSRLFNQIQACVN